MEKIFNLGFYKAAKYSLLLAILSPIVVFPLAVFPFITGKLFFFRFAITLALIFSLLNWAWEKIQKNDKAKTFIVVTTSIFAFIYVISCFFGINPNFSFWSNFERGEGGFQMIYYFIFFLLLVLNFREEKDWEKVAVFVFGAALFSIIYGICASMNILGAIGPSIFNRFYGTLGNADYLGTYMLFPMFFASWFLVKKIPKEKSLVSKILSNKFLLWSILIICFVFMLLSQTRGSFVGFGGGVFAGLLFLFFKSSSEKKLFLLNKIEISFKKLLGCLLVILVILGVIVMFFGKSINVPFCSGCNRLLNLSIVDFGKLPRVWVWEAAIESFKEKPVFGWGPENFMIAFDKHFDTRHYIPGVNSETWFDRAHSIYLDYLSQTGILGFLAYISIFVAVFIAILKSKVKNKEKSLVVGIFIAYLVQGIFLFEVLPIYLNLFLLLAFVNYFFFVDKEENKLSI